MVVGDHDSYLVFIYHFFSTPRLPSRLSLKFLHRILIALPQDIKMNFTAAAFRATAAILQIESHRRFQYAPFVP
ncbi:hypothetical protein WL88_29085 [Burkholderia diffusa]|uniref:Uncharacterized protein n=1 Tax=Burkholderia diffusa TaxID=488732 RepID=A0AAW3P8K1_9BURK|nr:hypothetical protein WL85_00280 [Burkholderia diffusa]KWF45134.1 hypothetical protein WL88_29085 [Burkholderia diffusa]KWF51117.1 hypothetical protein WL87_14730 [Burkholderia diffusa]